MSSSIADVCDTLLDVLRNHESGVPHIWPRPSRVSGLDEEYCRVHRALAKEVARLVVLNKRKQLQGVSIEELRIQADAAAECIPHVPRAELSTFLELHNARFRTEALLDTFLAAALPVLRATYHGNESLTDSEFAVLNNLKKLYSHYNTHAANISHVVDASKEGHELAVRRSQLAAQIDVLLEQRVALSVRQWRELHANLEAVRNTLENLKITRADAAARMPEETARLEAIARQVVQRLGAIRALCDLIPNLVRCLPGDWYSDTAMRAAVQESQAVGERMAECDMGKSDMEKDFEAIVAACQATHEEMGSV